MKNVLKSSAKNFLLPFGLSSGISAVDSAIQKEIYGSNRPSDSALRTTALIISNEEMEYITKTVKSLEESGLLIQEINKITKTKTKEQKDGFLSVLLGTLAASILGKALAGRGIVKAGQGIIRAGENFQCRLINFEIQKYY